MRNPTRRNRNIGTAKQGYGKSNKFRIPTVCTTSKSFFERLDQYIKVERIINDHQFIFVVEKPRTNSMHACSVDDVERIIQHIPASDYGYLKLIVFRQPKIKEEILNPVWGRLIYSYEFEDDYHPAVVLESAAYNKKVHWPNSLSPDERNELERLREDGHKITSDRRGHHFTYEPEYVRNTQLYRTLAHEFGHYVHYLDVVERPGTDDETSGEWEKRQEVYWKIPKAVKEQFAHSYADRLLQQLKSDGLVPFERL